VSVDGGYIALPQMLCTDRTSLDTAMSYWCEHMESERKHVECSFGILKGRFRIFKLPIQSHKFAEIDDMFVTCCILHNMCLDFDGGDVGWNVDGSDGEFSEDENHQTYFHRARVHPIRLDTDTSWVARCPVRAVAGSRADTVEYKRKCKAHAVHFYTSLRKRELKLRPRKRKSRCPSSSV